MKKTLVVSILILIQSAHSKLPKKLEEPKNRTQIKNSLRFVVYRELNVKRPYTAPVSIAPKQVKEDEQP